jgi:hypothetical protein
MPEEPLDGHEDVQAAVDQLAARLDLSVLVEDRRQRPVWWATRGEVDGTRVRTILNRRVDPPVARVVKTFDLANAIRPVRVPGIPELDMWARWCRPLRGTGEGLGLLWVLDPDDRVGSGELPRSSTVPPGRPMYWPAHRYRAETSCVGVTSSSGYFCVVPIRRQQPS